MQRPRIRPALLPVVAFALAAAALVNQAFADGPALRDVIDAEVAAVWKQEKVEPAPPADDAAFLRRIYLDLCGVIPTYEEAKAFLDDTAPDKRAKLIDKLMDDPRYARHQADVWDMVFFGRNPPGYQTDQRDQFIEWLRDQFAKDTGYDKICHAMLSAKGNSVDDGAPMYLVQYKKEPADAAVAITQTFLSVQLQCARCHDHPFEKWKQLDFYGMAAFLSRLDVIEVGKKDKTTKWAIAEKSTGELMYSGPAKDQKAGQKGEPVAPKFLAGDVLKEPELPKDFKEVEFKNGKEPPPPKFSRKDALADWVTAKDNPYFARSAANRVWAQFMGRGIVHPVIDMGPGNKPSHPRLMDALTAAMRDHDFDLKWYIRELVNSRTYQLASTGPVEAMLPRWFERARVRPLSAEELVESWRIATGYDAAMIAKGEGEKLKKERFYGLTWDYMRRFFGTPTTGAGDFEGGLQEHLFLDNGQVSQLITRDKGGLLDSLMKSDQPWDQRVERLFLSVLSRRPTPQEAQKFVEYFKTGKDNDEGRVTDAIWTLMTCSEYRFSH
jgi:Protein of unknown function (DUF1549)/Protein of unknown function (DUF1553)